MRRDADDATRRGGHRARSRSSRGAEPAQRPVRIGAHTFERCAQQARLQVEQRTTGELQLRAARARGRTAASPGSRAPSDGDLFFDMEGDPFFEDGLEYLFGVTWIEDGEPRFRAFWATSRAEEKRAFEEFIDFVMERLERFPDLHVYHYAPYEPTALKRLMGLHATREDELDHLLRNEVLVDLYAVVRQGLRISQPSYSIKKVEAFYMEERETEVAEGGDSIIAFEEFLETGDARCSRRSSATTRTTAARRCCCATGCSSAAPRRCERVRRRDPVEGAARAVGARRGGRRRRRRCARALATACPRTRRARRRAAGALAAGAAARLPPPRGQAGVVGVLRSSRGGRGAADRARLRGARRAEPSRRRAARRSRRPRGQTIYTLRFPPQEHKIGPGELRRPRDREGRHASSASTTAKGIVEIMRGDGAAPTSRCRAR